jgi:anti-anti-sigma factor
VKITTSEIENGVVLLEIEGEVDAHTCDKLDNILKKLLAQGHNRLVLDASQMEYISSPGLRILLSAQREARERGGEVRLFGLNAQVRRTFEMAGFAQLLPVADNRHEAIEGWSRSER